jgi:Fe2+ transport system protein B
MADGWAAEGVDMNRQGQACVVVIYAVMLFVLVLGGMFLQVPLTRAYAKQLQAVIAHAPSAHMPDPQQLLAEITISPR